LEVVKFLSEAWPEALQKKENDFQMLLHLAAASNNSLDMANFLACA
jgi:hypothetical protein